MKVGSIRRVIIPPSQGYQNTSQEPIPPNVSNPRQMYFDIAPQIYVLGLGSYVTYWNRMWGSTYKIVLIALYSST